MTKEQVVLMIFGVIIGGGGVGAVIPLFRYRTDRDSAVAIGAEAAVQSLTLALQRADIRILHLETKITALENIIDSLRTGNEKLNKNLTVTNIKLDQVIEGQEGLS